MTKGHLFGGCDKATPDQTIPVGEGMGGGNGLKPDGPFLGGCDKAWPNPGGPKAFDRVP